MKNLIMSMLAAAAFAATAQEPRRVVLVVQNHAESGLQIPMLPLSDAFTAELASNGFQVINPYNAIGRNMNRTQMGEVMPAESAVGIARRLNAHGVVTASVTSLEELKSRTPTATELVTYRVRVVFNLADAWSAATVASGSYANDTRQYKLQMQKDAKRRQHLEELLFSAGEECAKRLLRNENVRQWKPTPPPAPRPPSPRPPPPEPLSRDDLQRALESLSDKMFLSPRFNERHAVVVGRRSGKQPVVVVGGIGDSTGGLSPCGKLAIYRDLGKDFLQTRLGKSCRFEIKDLAAVESMRPFIVNSPKDPLSDRSLLEALRNYVSPDFLVAGHVKYDAENGLGTYFIHLGAYDFLLGVVVWEDTVEVVKSLPGGRKQ